MSRAPVVFVAGLLLGGAGAMVVANFVRDGTTSAATDADLARRLDALDAGLPALRTTLAEQPTPALLPARAEAAPAPLADTRIDDILARLDALQQQLSELPAARAPDASAEDDAASPKQHTVEPLPDKLPDEP